MKKKGREETHREDEAFLCQIDLCLTPKRQPEFHQPLALFA